MNQQVIHEHELGKHPALEQLVREIDERHPPVGYERLLYPWFLIMPENQAYVRLILDQASQLIIPLLPVDEAAYEHLDAFSRTSGLRMLLVDRFHPWLAQAGLRLVPVGVLQNIELGAFSLQGTRMRKLRYMVNRFASSGKARTVEYTPQDRPPLPAMIELMEAWGKAKNNVIWHTALCMEHLLKGELPAGHRAFLTFLDDRLCSIIVVEAFGRLGCLMDQEFYDPENAPLGHMEFAIVEMMERLRKEGLQVLSLGATWHPFPFGDHPHTDPEGWAWIQKNQERPTLLGKIFAQGQSNYQFKKKFGVEGEPLFAYLPPAAPWSTILNYWTVFYEHSLTPAQLSEQLRKRWPAAGRPCPSLDRPDQRQAAWDQAQRFEDLACSASPLDLMSDTWLGRELEPVRKRTEWLKRQPVADSLPLLKQLFPFKHLILTQRGRDAEALFYGQYPKARRIILTAIPWTSTLMHQLGNGFTVVEVPVPAALDPGPDPLFKGECDLAALQAHLQRDASGVGMVGLELLNNATGGHPVRLSHVQQLRDLLQGYGVPLVMDASRIVRNAVLLQRYDPASQERDVWWLVRELLAGADYVVTSLTKDFGVPAGGLIATNDDALAARIRECQSAQGSVDLAKDLFIEQSLADPEAIRLMIEEQLALTKSLQDRLADCGVPLCGPAYGHAIVIDCAKYLPDPESKAAREKFLRDLFIQTGVRGGIHQAGQQRQGRLARCIRLAFPLGLTRTHEELIFGKLREFLAPRTAVAAAPPSRVSPSDDFSAFIPNGESAAVDPEPSGLEAIAIIGLSGRFPEADNHYEFWAGIQSGANFVQEVPGERWNHKEYFDPQLGKNFVPHKTRCKFGAFLKGHDLFDAGFFNLSDQEVVMMDPQERLAMEVVWSCIEDAGYTPGQLGHEVGLFAGVTYNEYQKLIPRTTHSCFLTSRLAYFFNFNGPAAALDTGCASSMAAIDAACQSVSSRRCRTALVIGSNVILHPDHYASLSPELSSAREPESMPFGDADGWIPAEGVVAILLKPLSQARRDRDHIYAVIKASALGQEGKTSWFAAFSPKRQADFLQRSFERAGISPATISYVEAAANGSPLGDAIELEGLAKAFRQGSQRDGCCPIGTVKANAGHGESVSTLLQLTKVLLQFKAGEIYPLPHPERRNPNIRIQETPFRFPAVTEAWDRPTFLVDGQRFFVPRRASISSFGGGGNMGHLILEEAPPGRDGPEPLASYLLPLSAQNVEQLRGKAAELLAFFDHLETLDAHWVETYGLIHIMHTLWLGRVAQAQRVAFVVADLEELKDQCQRFLRQEPHPGILVQGQGVAGNLDVPGLIESQNWPELGRQWVSGREIPWGHFFDSQKANRVPLPGYRFDRKRHEISAEAFRRKGGNPIPEKTVPRPAVDLPPRVEESHLIRIVKAAFAKVLPAGREALDLARPLDQYGFDSAMVVGVAAELEKHFTRVPPTLFFECGTLGEVVECLRQATPRNGSLAEEAALAMASPAEESSGKAFNIDQVVEDILSYRLSAEQVLERLE